MTTNSNSATRRLALTWLVVTGWLACMLVLTLPGNLLLSNPGEFTIDARDLLAFSILMFVAAMAVASIVYLLIPAAIRPPIVALIFALTLLLWLQGNILVWDYGPLDGRSIAWGDHIGNGLIDTTIWILVIVLALAMRELTLKVALGFSAVILAASLVQFGTGALQQSGNAGESGVRKFQIDETLKFRFSNENNVILIVLDEFQSDVFNEVTAQPEYRRVFDGFTYFPDAVAGSNFTQLAIPALLTGTLYDNSVPRSEFMEETFLKYGITTVLKNAGFDVGVYP